MGAQLQIAIFEADLFVDFVVAQIERHRFGAVFDRQFVDDDFHFTRFEVGVFESFASGAYFSRGDEDILVAHFVGDFVRFGAVGGVADELYRFVFVSEVDKHDASVVSSARDPTRYGDGLSDERSVDIGAVVCSHMLSFGHMHRCL